MLFHFVDQLDVIGERARRRIRVEIVGYDHNWARENLGGASVTFEPSQNTPPSGVPKPTGYAAEATSDARLANAEFGMLAR